MNGLRAVSKKGLAKYLDKEKADYVCLQEIKAFREQCCEIETGFSYSHQEWHSAEKPGYSGTLTLARETPASSSKKVGMPEADREGRVIVTDLGPALLLNMYIPNGAIRHDFKMGFLERILKYFKKLDAQKPLILTGDFNIAHREIDIHDPVRLDGESGFKPEERAWMDQVQAAGFTDAFRYIHGDKRDEYSWWSYRQASRQRNKGWRIDYFWVSNRIANKIKNIDMHQKVEGSDHCPLVLSVF